MKNPTLEAGKKTAAHLAMQAMERGAPPTAPRVPGLPSAYRVHIEPDNTVYVFIYSWNWRGKCSMYRACPDSSWRITFKQQKFWLERLSFQLVKDGAATPDDWQRLRAEALQFWEGKDVSVPGQLAKGVSQAAVLRYRMKQATLALMKHLPEGFSFLVGCDKPAAYRVDAEGFVTFIQPKLGANKHPIGTAMETVFRVDRHPIYGTVIYRGAEYMVEGTRLYRPGKPEDIWSTSAQVDDRLLVRENAPDGVRVLDDGQAWYVIVPGANPVVEFHSYVRGVEQIKVARIKNGVVSYKKASYVVNADGSLKGLL